MAAANIAFAGKNAMDAIKAGQGTTIDGKTNQMPVTNDKGEVTGTRDATGAEQAGGINLSISIGSSSSQSKTTQTSDQARESTVAAGNNLNITASGSPSPLAGEGWGEGDITVQGSSLQAGNRIALDAQDEIRLLAAKNTAEQHSTNSSKSGSVGISIGTNGLLFTASASGARGNADGSDVTWTNTHVNAGNQVTLQSSGDTTMKGAVASGKQITANVGGNLNIESLQDTSQYDSKQQSIGGSISIGYGKVGGSFSASKSKVDSNFASVVEQSGIKAGDGGFNVNVAGNTDLKGGAITSTDQAVQNNKNTLTTATLTTSDIENRAEASAKSSGINLDSNMFSQGKYGIGKALIGTLLNNGHASGSSAGVTRSAVQTANIMISDDAAQQALTGKTAEQTVSSLNRDTANAHSAAQKQDVQAMERAAQAEQAIKQAVLKEATKFTDESYRKMFLVKHPMFEHVRGADGKFMFDENGKPVTRALSDDEKKNLKPGPDGKISIASNGIFNDANAAAKYASQHSTTEGPQYLIYFPEANNTVSELLIAGYQKFLENDYWGLSNSTQVTKDMMNQYGQGNLHLDGHSRGAMTIGNALESVQSQPNAQGTLSGTTVNFYGAAYNAEKADDILSDLQNRDAVTDLSILNGMVIQTQTHQADPVGRLVSGNPETGGTIPEDSNFAKEVFNVLGAKDTVHNCYGAGGLECKEFWNDLPKSRPVLQPVKIYPATLPKE